MKRTLNKLIMLRRRRSISQASLSQNMNISRGELSVIERGKRQLTFDRISKYVYAIIINESVNSKNKLTKKEINDLIEAVVSDFFEVFNKSLDDSIKFLIRKNISNDSSIL
jgi:transcriptional regulator with XRE-family HTH domain